MANMTIALDDQLLRAARIKAVQQGTSVNEVCRQAIESFARGAGDAQARMARLKVLAKKVRSENFQPMWPGRDALYAEPAEPPKPLAPIAPAAPVASIPSVRATPSKKPLR